jgi:hypothetical protein
MNRNAFASTGSLAVAMVAFACLWAGCSPGPAGAPEEGPYEAASLLRIPPREAGPAPATSPDPGSPSRFGPDAVVLDRLENRVGRSVFDHRSHAHMASPGEGCGICHHHSLQDGFRSCGGCHTVPLDGNTAGSLGLKGAYHARCQGCHEACGAATGCAACHERKGAAPCEAGTGPCKRKAKLAGTIVYETPKCEGTRVTFNHACHASDVEGGCVACHANRSCVECHRGGGARPERRRGEPPHGRCFPCHGKDADLELECFDCHGK